MMQSTVNASSTSPTDWQYVSEGGATIVFSYRGHRHSIFTGNVLRLRKIKFDQIAIENPSERAGEEPDDPTIEFQRRVTSKLLPPENLPRLETVQVYRPWLEDLQRLAEGDRPPERRRIDTIDVNRRKAVLATDLVGGEGWAVEIKVSFHRPNDVVNFIELDGTECSAKMGIPPESYSSLA